MIDERDSDINGDGLANFQSDGSGAPSLVSLPDIDGNGILDTREIDEVDPNEHLSARYHQQYAHPKYFTGIVTVMPLPKLWAFRHHRLKLLVRLQP